MTRRLYIFIGLTLLCLGLQLYGEYTGVKAMVYVFKPLAMAWIIWAAVRLKPVSSIYKALMLAGLGASLLGDILLMFSPAWFIPGLVSFLIAHLFYIAAFKSRARLRFSVQILAPLVIYGTAMFFMLAPGTGKLTLPVMAYLVVILVMAWQAAEQWRQVRSTGTGYAFWGALFFVASDSALALNKFYAVYRAAPVVIMATYLTAQWLLTLSIHEGLQQDEDRD